MEPLEPWLTPPLEGAGEPGRETGYWGDEVCFQIGKHMFRPVSVSVDDCPFYST